MTLHRRDGNHIWYSRELHRTLYGCTCVREKTYDLLHVLFLLVWALLRLPITVQK